MLENSKQRYEMNIANGVGGDFDHSDGVGIGDVYSDTDVSSFGGGDIGRVMVQVLVVMMVMVAVMPNTWSHPNQPTQS